MDLGNARREMHLNHPFRENFSAGGSRDSFAKADTRPHLKGSVNNPMTTPELKNRKKWHSRTSLTASTLGLGGLGVIGAAAIARKKPGMLGIKAKAGSKVANKTALGIKDKGYLLGSAAGGVGGVGGLNFAAIQRAESNKGKHKPVVKMYEEYRPATKEETAGYRPPPPSRKAAKNSAPKKLWAVKTDEMKGQQPALIRSEGAPGPGKLVTDFSDLTKSYNAYTGTESANYTPKKAKRSPNPERSRRRRQAIYTPAAAVGAAGLVAGSEKVERAVMSRTGAKALKEAQPKHKVADYKKVTSPEEKLAQQAKNKVAPNQTRSYMHAMDNLKEAEKITVKRNRAGKRKHGQKVKQAGLDIASDVSAKTSKVKGKGRRAMLVGAGALAAAGVGNEIHRYKSGKTYKGNFDHYRKS